MSFSTYLIAPILDQELANAYLLWNCFLGSFSRQFWGRDYSNLFFFFILVFNFTILYWFCHISTWIRHRHTCVPHPEPSSLLPPRTIPLGRPSTPAPSIQYRASNLDWRLISYMILYMFQYHSPKSPHPLPLPQSPKDYSIHWRGYSNLFWRKCCFTKLLYSESALCFPVANYWAIYSSW